MKDEMPSQRQQDTPKKWHIGDKIEARYEVRDIKKGGMGIVYIVLDHHWNRMFALKTFQDKFLWEENAIDRFINEAMTWVNLGKHTNIVFANFVKTIEGKPYIFLEYIEGGDLSRYIGKLDIPHALDFAIQFCNGMDYAHKTLGLIHRDIKPQNAMITTREVMITTGEVLKVTDFGLAKAVKESVVLEGLDRGDSIVSRGMGTRFYMPPEQFLEEEQMRFHFPSRNVTTRSDIYSFGVTFYHVLTGSLPFLDEEQIFTLNPLSPKSLNPDIPKELDLLLMKCLEKHPQNRYPSFESLISELVRTYHALPREQRVFGKTYVVKGKKGYLTAEGWSNRGMSLVALGRYPEAIDCCDKALERNPRDAFAWTNKGNALASTERHAEAIGCYDKALEITPRDAGMWMNKGASLASLGRFPEAIDCCDKALEIDPGDAEVWGNKGAFLKDMGKFPEAIDCCDRALEIDPGKALCWNIKGEALKALARHLEAIYCYDKALNINPRLVQAWVNKGTSLVFLGRHPEAIECYDKSLRIDPRYALAWGKKGSCLQQTGRYPEAIYCIKKFVELAPPKYVSLVKEAKAAISQLEKKCIASG